ncbi:S8 family serine peptidase [Antribacter gilvus]|uniref:S8 family serine peptidase n=1 Tax=Antribacter gilvus TaxID=2304675 RepID=UPI001F0C324E|nr:S8 family serine peptidase [Antribacter gilvus]
MHRRTMLARRGAVAVTALASLVVASALGVAPAIAAPSPTAPLPTSLSAADVAVAAEDKLTTTARDRLEAGTADFWVKMADTTDLSTARGIVSWADRGQFVYDALTKTAEASQAGTVAELQAVGAEYETFWISNRILVKAGTLKLATSLAASAEVKEIHETETLEAPEPVEAAPSGPVGLDAPEWGLNAIRAPEAWAMGVTGEGIVVSSVDSGVQYDHPALVNQYRGNDGDGTFTHDYNWFDTSGRCGGVPCDFAAASSHGTHTMGTMLGSDGGSNQIGVAPGARWIESNGCDTCSDADLIQAGQWITAPTNLAGTSPDPAKRPHVVNNSWGISTAGVIDPEWYMDVTAAWEAAGIFAVWSAGNKGPTCDTTSSPGANLSSYSVGALQSNGTIASFSSRGEGEGGQIKPHIAAPGAAVRSSIINGQYGNLSGTSMAAPHVAGAVALLWSYAPALVGDVTETRRLLDASAVDTSDTTCGGTAADNNVYGEGKLDVVRLLELAPLSAGTVAGTVTGAGAPVAGATVVLDGSTDRTVTTGADGTFSVSVEVGDYTVSASAFGFVTESTTATVAIDATTTVDFDLAAASRYAVSGTVTDKLAGGAVSGATVTLAPGSLSTTTAADGTFSFPAVPAGTYTLGTPGSACADASSTSVVVDGNETVPVKISFRYDGGGYFCSVGTGGFVAGDTKLTLTGDDVATSVPLPFAFPLYGTDYSTAFVSSNGFLNFLASATSLSNVAIPAAGVPNAALYPFWDDLLIDSSAGVYTATSTIGGVQAFTLEWRNVRKYSPSTDRVNFSVTMFEDGKVVYGYGDLTETATAKGSSATVGLENANGTIASQFSYNTAGLSDGMSITYDLAPMGTVSGVVKDYNTKAGIAGADVVLTAADGRSTTLTTGADGTYSTALVIGRYALAFSADAYQGVSRNITVTDGGALVSNAQLKAGRLVVSTTAITSSLAMGGSVSRNVRVTNTGSAPVEVNLSAGGSDFAPLGATGATGVVQGVEKPATSVTTSGSGGSSTLARASAATKATTAATSVTPAMDIDPLATTITHSASQNILEVNSVACPSGPTSHLRTFTLSDFGVDGSFDVSSVSFGVEMNRQAQDVDVNLYTLSGAFVYANLTPIGSTTVNLPAQELTMVEVPVTGAVPAGGTLVVEISQAIGGSFYIGSNDAGETAPSYIASETCGMPDPASVEGECFPGVHYVINVTGDAAGGGSGVEWLDVQPPSFTLAPGQSVVAIATMSATVDQPGTYTANITVGGETPYANPSVATTMTVKAPAGWGKITGTVYGNGTPLDGAVVHLDGISYDVTLLTDADGTYSYWMQKSNAPLQLTVAAAGFVPQTTKAQIIAGQTTVYDFNLAPLP